MVTTPFSVFGYASTCSDVNDLKPTTRMARLTTEASTGRRTKISVKFMRPQLLFVGRIRTDCIGRQHVIVDSHRDAVAKLDLAGGHDDFARFDAALHGDLIAAGGAQFDETLLHFQSRMTLVIDAVLFHDIHRISIRVIGHRGLRQGYGVALIAILD